MICYFLSAFLDAFDGMAARALKQCSKVFIHRLTFVSKVYFLIGTIAGGSSSWHVDRPRWYYNTCDVCRDISDVRGLDLGFSTVRYARYCGALGSYVQRDAGESVRVSTITQDNRSQQEPNPVLLLSENTTFLLLCRKRGLLHRPVSDPYFTEHLDRP